MGLRYLLLLLTIVTCVWTVKASSLRLKRQVSNNFPGQPSEPKAYQPPIALGAPSIPVASSATLQNSYQPPISLLRSNEYQSPLNAPRTYQSPPVPGHSSQTYVLPNQPQNQPRSVQYIPPALHSGNVQQSFSVLQQPAPNSVPRPATSFSVQQQPPQSFPILSDSSGLPPHSTAERTYSTHSKVVESHVPAQAIHKAPASEIQSEKGPAAKEKDNKNDEYVVYYYYYYDNDTSANNLSLNFDDIPSLEAYDNDKLAKDPEKSASARTLAANVNALTPVAAKSEKDAAGQTESISSQPRSVGDVYSRPNSHSLDDSLVQPLKPVSNVFRYGSNEVPRFPVLPNFIVTEVPTTVKSEIATPDSLTTVPPVTQPALINVQPDLKTGDETDDDINNVLDHASDNKAIDDKIAEEELTTTTTTTTTEPPTTTEEPTTTTEKPRRSRPSFGGGRRRFNPSPASAPSFSSSRSRQTQGRSSTSSTTTTSTTSAPTRRSFQGSRIRPRPSIGSNRPRPSSRTSETSEDKSESRASEATTVSTTTSRSRFTSSSPRRFQSSRSRSQTTSSTTSTTSTTRAPSSAISSRSRPSTRPRPNLISRNRPARPGFPRPRPGSEPEEPETTTTAAPPTEEEISPETANDELPSTNDESNETDEDNETSVEETEEPTTTEGNRFSALFRPRNRNALGNRPRPVIGNRPPRS